MQISQKEVSILLKKYSIPYANAVSFKEESIENIRIKYPVALKVDSPSIVHKSDLGFVQTNIANKAELERTMKSMLTILKMHGFSDYSFVAQEMLSGTELLIGMKRDTTFGPVIMFGFGGIFVEAIKDVSMRIAPVDKKMAIEMLGEIKGKMLLEGYRGRKPVSKEKIVDIILKLSRLALNEKSIMEIDFNPVMANENYASVADGRIIVKDDA